ncbi:CHAT domain-containing protein [Hoeflea marina]|uniref:CHAT domain-containing protein n=2 Tax=Hoeflea marina TaxID=274592 RepID=A0A317PL22_9HYPH|nr:CHAT domain-containing protein [Hoeflea marina]
MTLSGWWRLAGCLAGLAASLSASAATVLPADRDWQDAKGWKIYWSDGFKGCLAEQQQADGAMFLLGVSQQDRRFSLLVLNDAMSAFEPGKEHRLDLVFDGRINWRTGFAGIAIDSKAGILGTYPPGEFQEQVAHSSTLEISNGQQRLVKLSLKGTRGAINAVTECHAALFGSAAEQSASGDKLMEQARRLHAEGIERFKAGDPAGAEAALAKVPELLTQAFGPDHPAVADSIDFLGMLTSEIKGPEAAEPLFRRALAIRAKVLPAGDLKLMQSYRHIARTHIDRRNFAAAEPELRRAVEIATARLAADDPQLADILSDFGATLSETGKHAEAVPLVRSALDIRKKALGEDHPQVAATFYNLGVALAGVEAPRPGVAAADAVLAPAPGDDAALALESALAIQEKALPADDIMISNTLSKLGDVLLARKDFAAARPEFERALVIREAKLGPDHPQVQYLLESLSAIAAHDVDYAKAEALFRRALEIRRKDKGASSPDYATGLAILARRASDNTDYSEAEALNLEALGIRETALGSDDPAVADSLTSLANVRIRLADLDGAEEAADRALKILDAGAPGRIDALMALGEIAAKRGDAGRSEEIYGEALSASEAAFGKSSYAVANNLANLAIVISDRGEPERGEQLLTRAVAIYEAIARPNDPAISSALDSLAAIRANRDDIAGAEQLYRRIIDIKTTAYGSDHVGVAKAEHNFARMLTGVGRFEEAEPLYRHANSVIRARMGTDHPDYGQALVGLAFLRKKQGDHTESESLYREARDIYQRNFGPDSREQFWILDGLAEILRQRGDVDEALALLRPVADKELVNRRSYLPLLVGGSNQTPETVREGFEAIQRMDKSKAASALRSLSVRFAAGSDELADLVRLRQDGEADLARLKDALLAELSRAPAERQAEAEAALRKDIAAAAGDLDAVGTRLAEAFPEYAELSGSASLPGEAVQRLLKPEEVLVLIDIAGDRDNDGEDYVWAVSAGEIAAHRLDTARGEIAEAVTALRRGLELDSDEREAFDAALAHDLYTKLIGPVSAQIEGRSEVLFVLNGPVSSLPMQLLVTADPAGKPLREIDWFIRDHAVTVLPSVSSLSILRAGTDAAQAAKQFRGYGDPVFRVETGGQAPAATDSGPAVSGQAGFDAYFKRGLADVRLLSEGLVALPETADELRRVAASLGASEADIVLGHAASEAAIKADVLGDYGIVYFATHGLVAGETAQVTREGAEPALVLSLPQAPSPLDDGLLTASEVAQLKLNADWVVLSACNTAAGDGNGADALSGLARAFFYAGARSMLVSHWAVASDATVALMTRTFDEASSPQTSGAEAIRRAMISMIDDARHPEWADPAYWAPFILVGEPRGAES